MEETKSLSTKLSEEDQEQGEEEEEELYEQIEAPKFVDFTLPDPRRPDDDRYWFCLRVGCDRKHEEEMDSEAIYKNFVLKVLAARSPNVRLSKALNKKDSSANIKCPQSAPAKPLKSRISKLAVISSISRKPLPKLTSTPKATAKQIASKYMTTPRNRKSLPKRNSFRTVQHAKSMTVAEPKNRIVAKALVFGSPKKAVSVKTSGELHRPLTKIYARINRLEITSQRKRVLGYSGKSLKGINCDSNKSATLDPSRNRVSANKCKCRMPAQNCKDLETKTLGCMKGKIKGNLAKQREKMTKERAENDSTDMEIDGRSKNGSVLKNSRVSGNGDQEHLPINKMLGNAKSEDSTENEAALSSQVPSGEKTDTMISDSTRSERCSLSNSEAIDTERNHFDRSQTLDEKEDSQVPEKNTNSISGNGDISSASQNQTFKEVEHENEVMDYDDKENASAPDATRHLNNNIEFTQKVLSRQEMHKTSAKAAQKLNKNLKEGTTSSATNAPETKHEKPRATNPKPFRLRTDERGILKEANFERKIQFLAAQKETETIPRIQGGNSRRKQGGNDISDKESETIGAKNSSKKTSSPLMQGFVRTHCQGGLVTIHSQGVASGSTSKAMAMGQQLIVVNENAPTIASKHNDSKNGGSKSSRGRRPLTIPKEPKFHTARLPKSCTKKMA